MWSEKYIYFVLKESVPNQQETYRLFTAVINQVKAVKQ